MRTAARGAGEWNTELGARNEDDATAAVAARTRTRATIIPAAGFPLGKIFQAGRAITGHKPRTGAPRCAAPQTLDLIRCSKKV
eukprot:scaffold12576_cov59-Phaeocystis_antarctica.AAC.2